MASGRGKAGYVCACALEVDVQWPYVHEVYQTEGHVAHAHWGWTYVRVTMKFFPLNIRFARFARQLLHWNM